MFERFTAEARQTVVEAQAQARRLRHSWIGTEHLLLGLLAQPTCPAARVLRSAGVEDDDVRRRLESVLGSGGADHAEALATLGIDLDAVRRRAEESFGPGALQRTRAAQAGRLGGHIRFTPRAKLALELSLREALALRHRWIGTEHLLLGLLREGSGLGAQLLAGRLTHDAARAAVLEQLADAGG